MAVDPKTLYIGRIDTSDLTGYPLGKCQNESAPAADDGTPSDEAWMNDTWGFYQALLAAAAMTPSGSPDKVGASQYLTALQTLFALTSDSRFLTATQATGVAASPTPITGGNPAASIADITAISTQQIAIFDYQENQNTAGSAISTGAWTKILLNTIIQDYPAWATISSGVVALAAGSYRIAYMDQNFDDPLAGANVNSELRCRNTSDSSDANYGQRAANNAFAEFDQRYKLSVGPGEVFTIAGAKNYELQYMRNVGGALGYPANVTGYQEHYGRLAIVKVA